MVICIHSKGSSCLRVGKRGVTGRLLVQIPSNGWTNWPLQLNLLLVVWVVRFPIWMVKCKELDISMQLIKIFFQTCCYNLLSIFNICFPFTLRVGEVCKQLSASVATFTKFYFYFFKCPGVCCFKAMGQGRQINKKCLSTKSGVSQMCSTGTRPQNSF